MRIVDVARTLKHAAAWREGHLALLLRGHVHRARNRGRGFTDRDHLRAAAEWLKRAQDASKDGGIAGRYRLDRGFTSSYPETTGYAIPTLLSLADELEDEDYVERAERCVRFLLGMQLQSGAFPGLEVAENRTEPSSFNTAQIVNGLVAWHRHSGDWRAQEAAARAGHWLVSIQDKDGAFRAATYGGVASAYAAHASCWLAELGQHLREPRFLAAAERHLDWVLAARDPATGFIDRMGFSAEDHAARRAVTHTIAYTLAGLLLTAQIRRRDDAFAAVRHAATRIARRLELDGRLPGVLDHRFRGLADWECLTGNAQMAIVWMRLWQAEGDPRFLNAAFKALDRVKDAQPMESENPGIRGGIPGSDPITGDYIRLALPNWAAKFFVDALLLKKHVMATVEAAAHHEPPLPAELPETLPAVPSKKAELHTPPPPRVVLLASPKSRKVLQILAACADVRLRPCAVVIEDGREAPARARLARRVREHGLEPLLERLAGTPPAAPAPTRGKPGAVLPDDPAALCRDLGIPLLRVPSLADASGVDAVGALEPDLAVCAGAGLLREGILAVPRLGTLNAHMGLLPVYRGMNVAEWTVLRRDVPGVSVHLVDRGIDTGDILVVRRLCELRARSVPELRAAVDEAQIALLGYVLRWIQRTGLLPPRVPQARIESGQYFAMHPELLDVVERRLRAAAEAPAS